jgi:subtilisin family serine protease
MATDYKLLYLQRQSLAEERIRVLVWFRNNVSSLAEAGFLKTSVAGDVAAGSVPAERLDELSAHRDVIFVETSGGLKDETDLSAVAINLVNAETGSRLVPGNGRRAIVGVIDSGFDLTHPCFSDAEKRTRIIAAWDQVNVDGAEGEPPHGFDYGIEYGREQIDRLQAGGKILVIKNEKGFGDHGTSVAGIAAGNGAPEGIFVGVAPEAELILVAYKNTVRAGGSAHLLDAICYVRERARAASRPVVINISQGDNLGAHDGTSLLERAIDNVVAEGDVLIVTSAGNERAGREIQHRHARGEVRRGVNFVLPFQLLASANMPVDGDGIELWYRRGDRFAVALRPPGGAPSAFVAPGERRPLDFPPGATAHVFSELELPTNGDNRIGIIFEKGEGWLPGRWELILRGEEVNRGDFDAWADRPNSVTVVDFPEHRADASTVTLPGNARRAITVGSSVSRPPPGPMSVEVRGGISSSSSIGPTRDGRVKPDITAPGSLITAPPMRREGSPVRFVQQRGTSMAAPHVSGTIALLWGLWPGLTAGQITSALYSTASNEPLNGVTPNTCWGHGKLDAEAAYKTLVTLMKNGGL